MKTVFISNIKKEGIELGFSIDLGFSLSFFYETIFTIKFVIQKTTKINVVNSAGAVRYCKSRVVSNKSRRLM